MNYKRSKYFSTSNKEKIKYFYLNNKNPIAVVFFHGFMSDMIGEKPTAIEKFCRKKKLNFLKFEYSGHGRSSGKFIEGNISKWTSEAKQIIKSKINKNQKVIFIGSSMGSWIALNLFSLFKKQIKGFIGIASAPEFLEELMWKKFNKKIKKTIMKKKIYYVEKDGWGYPITKQLILDGKKNKVLKMRLKNKILVTMFHGAKDDVVPINFSRKVLKIFPRATKKLFIIKKGDHSLSKKNYLDRMCKNLDRMIKNIT